MNKCIRDGEHYQILRNGVMVGSGRSAGAAWSDYLEWTARVSRALLDELLSGAAPEEQAMPPKLEWIPSVKSLDELGEMRDDTACYIEDVGVSVYRTNGLYRWFRPIVGGPINAVNSGRCSFDENGKMVLEEYGVGEKDSRLQDESDKIDGPVDADLVRFTLKQCPLNCPARVLRKCSEFDTALESDDAHHIMRCKACLDRYGWAECVYSEFNPGED